MMEVRRAELGEGNGCSVIWAKEVVGRTKKRKRSVDEKGNLELAQRHVNLAMSISEINRKGQEQKQPVLRAKKLGEVGK